MLSVEAKTGRIEDIENFDSVSETCKRLRLTLIIEDIGAQELDPAEEEGSTESKFSLERNLSNGPCEEISGNVDFGLNTIDRWFSLDRRSQAGIRYYRGQTPTVKCLVVIQLKAGMADLRSIGQLSSLILHGQRQVTDTSRPLCGILVASDLDSNLAMSEEYRAKHLDQSFMVAQVLALSER